MFHRNVIVILLIFFLLVSSSNCFSSPDRPIQEEISIFPPEQPLEGPGGSNYTHNSIKTRSYRFGGQQVWIFLPDDPQPVSASIVIFYHGWSAFLPVFYRDWIEHLVYHGSIVVYPRYQRGLTLGHQWFYENAMNAAKFALTRLQKNNNIIPDLDKVAVVGHSLGGGMCLYHAAYWNVLGLPQPQAIMAVKPVIPTWETIELHNVNTSTNLLVIIGEDDEIADFKFAKTIYYNTTQIPFDQKNYVIMQTDTYGDPDLVANHIAPLCTPLFSSTDALEFYGTWKLFDALLDFSFNGINKDYCLGNTTEQRFMGLWSDDTPVNELTIVENP